MSKKPAKKTIKVEKEQKEVEQKEVEQKEQKVEEQKEQKEVEQKEDKVEEQKEDKVEEVSSDGPDVSAMLKKAFKSVADSFKSAGDSFTAQKTLFVTIKRALDDNPSTVPGILEGLAKDFPTVIDESSLRNDNSWATADERGAYNSLIGMLMIKEGVIEPYFMSMPSLKGFLSNFGENGHYLASLYTEV